MKDVPSSGSPPGCCFASPPVLTLFAGKGRRALAASDPARPAREKQMFLRFRPFHVLSALGMLLMSLHDFDLTSISARVFPAGWSPNLKLCSMDETWSDDVHDAVSLHHRSWIGLMQSCSAKVFAQVPLRRESTSPAPCPGKSVGPSRLSYAEIACPLAFECAISCQKKHQLPHGLSKTLRTSLIHGQFDASCRDKGGLAWMHLIQMIAIAGCIDGGQSWGLFSVFLPIRPLLISNGICRTLWHFLPQVPPRKREGGACRAPPPPTRG